jgi:hypothetical protein
MQTCNAVGRRGQIKLYEIGERLNLSRTLAAEPGDRRLFLVDKHSAMGKLVSAERKTGLALCLNATRVSFRHMSAAKNRTRNEMPMRRQTSIEYEGWELRKLTRHLAARLAKVAFLCSIRLMYGPHGQLS